MGHIACSDSRNFQDIHRPIGPKAHRMVIFAIARLSCFPRMPNLKFASLAILELLSFNEQKINKVMWPWPHSILSFLTFYGWIIWTAIIGPRTTSEINTAIENVLRAYSPRLYVPISGIGLNWVNIYSGYHTFIGFLPPLNERGFVSRLQTAGFHWLKLRTWETHSVKSAVHLASWRR